MAQDDADVDFAALDPLLEQALELDESALAAFLAAQPPPLRERLRALLDLSAAMTIGDLAAQASRGIEDALDEVRATEAGRWHLERELGSGGMGQVFFATRTEPGGAGYAQRAAVKVLWSHQVGSDATARFYRERRLLAAFDHPGLARFLDGGVLADGRPWFAMEFIEGEDLVRFATNLALPARMRLFATVCDSVAYAHERLTVHRDIKPGNVLVDSTGNPRLLDFGIASVMDGIDDGVHTRTQGGPMTLQYASPEQVTGGFVTVASDVYQLGLLLYELLTGRRPYEVKDRALGDALQLICDVMPAPPSSLNPAIDADVDAIVGQALRKAPQDRYPSVQAFAADIERYLQGRPVTAMPASRWYVAKRFVARNLLPVSMAVLLVLGLSASTIVSVVMANRASEQAQRSAASQRILADVFAKAEPFSGGGARITLAQALIAAQPSIETQVAGDPELGLEVNRTLGEIYTRLGLIEQERSAYQAVIDAAAALGDADGANRMFGVAGIGNLLARANPADAIAYLEAQLPPEPPSAAAAQAWASAQFSLVGSLNRLRRYDRVAQQTQRMQEQMQRFNVTSPRLLGHLAQSQAGVARRAGDQEAEERLWAQAVMHMRRAQAPEALAVALSNYGIALGRFGRYAASEAAFVEAIALYDDAQHSDDSLAGVLRSYAGLLFRMERFDQSRAASTRALRLLDPEDQPYARFVTGLNLVYYTFAQGDPVEALTVTMRVLHPLLAQFPPESGVADRLRGLFAKLLVFGRQESAARQVLASGCDGESVFALLDPLEDPAELEARDSLWLRADVDSGESLQPDALLAEAHKLPFFDVLDEWRLLTMLSTDAKQGQRLLELESLRDAMASALAQPRENSVTALVALLRDSLDGASGCAQSSKLAASS